jgi:putative transposase
MARLPRNLLPDGIYHVTTRGAAAAPVFLDDDDRLYFLRLFAKTVDLDSWHCHAFCLMTNHYHLVVESLLTGLSRGLHRLNGLYAQRFNRRHDRTGHLFGSRYSAYVIEREEHLREACEYVIQNPVRAGLCEDAAEWPWAALSSSAGG